ncbi:MAG: tryptophan--tRNA ligase, partial [Proteobacteria bacterium]|nr:tryptophan--tRNA ligase [Pseudomonadota bacterium]
MRALSGTTPSGENLHLGNYFGALRQYLAYQEKCEEALYFIADYHSMNVVRNAADRRRNTLNVALDYLAVGLDPERAILFRQSDVAEVHELAWMLSTLTPMGLLERGHAYKDRVTQGQSADHGLFAYPVLMAADILLYRADVVPVGQDQKQHVEMARDIAQRFNHHYGDVFVLPEAIIGEDTAVLKGLDGRKMSKSYNNTIPLFTDEKRLRKLIMKIKTNSLEPGEPKVPADSTLFDIYKAFATPDEAAEIETRYAEGIAWGD